MNLRRLWRGWWPGLLVLASVVGAAEPPPVPDPLGLGDRLVLIEHLRTEFGLTIEAGIDEAELQRRYAQAWQARQPADVDADQRARLRQRLQDRWRVQVPQTADLAAMQAIEQRLLAEKAERDAEYLRQRLATQPEPELSEVRPPPAPAAIVVKPGAEKPAPAAGPTATILPFAVDGVAGALLIRGRKSALCVQFGHERGTEFNGVFEGLFAMLEKGKGPPDAVFLLGHGSGVSINGAPIGPHLRQHREFYETFGGTRKAQRIECLVIASCSKGSPVQMSAMRDGFGYYPTWRVATAERCYASAVSVLAAFQGIADRTADAPFRGIFRMGREPEVVGSVGEVGVNGDKAGMDYFDIGVEGGAIRVRER
jgi:hypothetical protein